MPNIEQQLSASEARALDAQGLPPFQDFNLLGVKAGVMDALKQIGKHGIFEEYTLHDVSHVDKMLATIEWLVPEATAEQMTSADWLMVVLAVYFHDLGMLVTKSEYESREESDFRSFCQQELFSGDAGTDYKSKLTTLEDPDKFLYEEYVRAHHAARVGEWIRGKTTGKNGLACGACDAVASLLSSLPQVFREDLAVVCESHHASDLDDIDKYPLSQPYGDSDDATANVQYAALLLRSADLLHITSDRCPSIMFRLIDPQDPISQREWAQQAAVRRVRAQMPVDEEGKARIDAQSESIEIFALFTNSDAFFGLKAYLSYAEAELQQAANWADSSLGAVDREYRFPWRYIDSTNVQADGFLDRQLAFSLDQERILELLTGHTLYNDTSVVLRELVQNSLDAIRLQAFIEGHDPQGFIDQGLVEIEWDPSSRELVVRDNGTGMTQNVIERNLLRAGASRYQEKGFKRQYPTFSPISRFGIGVLSTFMIADAVTVTTCTDEEEQARQLTLRSVHGDYLVSLLDKTHDALATRLVPHGTEVRLRIRKSAKLRKIEDALTHWIVVPRCEVRLTVSGETSSIGFRTPRQALEAVIESADLELYSGPEEPNDRAVRVFEETHQGVHTAVAIRWNSYLRRWAFLKIEDGSILAALAEFATGTCVEGVRVEEATAGFKDRHILALADARGLGAPKTNVARSDLDATTERRAMLHAIYRAYLSHVVRECEDLHTARGTSLTWASQEASNLLEQLLSAPEKFSSTKSAKPVDLLALREEVKKHPLVLVEEKEKRQIRAVTDLGEIDSIWTVDSALLRAAEGILREVPVEGSLHALSSGFGTDVFSLPDGVTLVGFLPGSTISREVLEDREVGRIQIDRERRRVDLAWMRKGDSPSWQVLSTLASWGTSATLANRAPVFVGVEEIALSGQDDDSAIRAFGGFFILPHTPLAKWLREQIARHRGRSEGERVLDGLATITRAFFDRHSQPDDLHEFVESILERSNQTAFLSDHIERDDLLEALGDTPNSAFNTWASYTRIDSYG
jgi:molecular chaperone HtpG